MTSQEQAYIDGFIKRAAEHGLNSNEALELFKEAARGHETLKALTAKLSPRVKPMLAGANIPGQGSQEASRMAETLRLMRKQEKNLMSKDYNLMPGSFEEARVSARDILAQLKGLDHPSQRSKLIELLHNT